MLTSELIEQLKAPFVANEHPSHKLPGGEGWLFVPWQIVRNRMQTVDPNADAFKNAAEPLDIAASLDERAYGVRLLQRQGNGRGVQSVLRDKKKRGLLSVSPLPRISPLPRKKSRPPDQRQQRSSDAENDKRYGQLCQSLGLQTDRRRTYYQVSLTNWSLPPETEGMSLSEAALQKVFREARSNGGLGAMGLRQPRQRPSIPWQVKAVGSQSLHKGSNGLMNCKFAIMS